MGLISDVLVRELKWTFHEELEDKVVYSQKNSNSVSQTDNTTWHSGYSAFFFIISFFTVTRKIIAETS